MDLLNPFEYHIKKRLRAGSNVEIEAKKNIDQFSFQTIRMLLSSLDTLVLSKYSTFTYNLGRDSSMRQIKGKTDKHEIKNRIGRASYNGTIVTISDEIPISEQEFYDKLGELRNRNYFRRDIIRLSSKKFKIDLSKVTSHIWNRNLRKIVPTDSYELELEYDYNSNSWQRFLELIDKYISIVHSNRPIDLHFNNLTFSNLIQNPYTLSVKADGIHRKLLLHKRDHKMYIKFTNSKNDLRSIELTGDVNKFFPENEVYLFDGEYMEHDDSFHIFDILIYKNAIISRLKFKSRYNRMVETFNNMNKLKASGINLYLKNHIFIKSPEEFFDAVEKTLSTKLDNDGIIFTPVNDVYLSSFIFKWKPLEKLTIDLYYENKNVYVYNPKTRKNVPFGKKFNINLGSLIYKYPDGKVIEFVIDLKTNTLTAQRIRADKVYPNKYTVVENILHLHRNPITKETITGKNTTLMRKYHNRVKTKIYNNLRLWGVNTILDIGSGLGGDILKWKSNGFNVTGIEPNPNNVQELKRRLDFYNFRINLHEGKFEDVKLDEKFDCITSFNSFTFLTKTNKYMENVVDKMMKHDSKYIVIVGFDVVKFFNFNKIKLGSGVKKYKTPNFDIEVDTGNNKVIIEILTGASVPRQEEYIINFEHLKTLFKGYKTIEDRFLADEKLMSKEQYFYSSATRLLIFKKEKSIKRPRLYKNIKMLRSQEQKYVGTLHGYKMYRIGSIGDNNCLIHAIMDMYNFQYQQLSDREKSKKVLEVRRYLCSKFTKRIWDKYIGSVGNEVLEKEYSYKNMKADLCKMSTWLDDVFMPYLSDIFKKNLVVYRLNSSGDLKYISDYNIDPNYQKDRDTIVLYFYYKDGVGHYEGMGMHVDDSLVTMIRKDTPLHKLIQN